MKKSKIKNKKAKISKRLAGHQKKKRPVPSQAGGPPLPDVLRQALALHKAGRLAQAETLYRQILQAEPNHPDALHYLGMLAYQAGNAETAVELLRRALAIRPDNAEALNNLGNALQALGKQDDAIASYRQVIALQPRYAEAHYNLGNALRVQNQIGEAIACYQRALALKPDYFEACYNLGILLQIQGKAREAEASFRRVVTQRPDFAGAHNNLGLVLQIQNKMGEAEASYRRALTLKPDFAEALNNLGNVLHTLGKPGSSEECYRRALVLKPDYVEALTNLGSELQEQDKMEEAAACYGRALALEPDYVDAHNNLGTVLLAQGKVEKAMASFKRALSLQPDFPKAQSNLLMCLTYLPNYSPSLYLKEARSYGEQVTAKTSVPFSDWAASPNPTRLCVGMVSGDFRSHSVGFFLENLLANIDQKHIELRAYSTNSAEDALTDRIRPRFVGWTSLTRLDDETAARRIYDDGVHILMDLSGHTSNNRLPVFARKPAPIQVNWLGYSASTGLQQMDYLLADPYVVPPGEEAYFTETIYRLPESYLCFSLPPEPAVVGPLPTLQEGRITFGSFNNATKMNDAVVALWARVLHAVPASRLFLKAKQFTDSGFCESVRQRFASCDIPPERLQLEGFVSLRKKHLANYNRVDIALDPFPYNGTTTSVEALWMGVPLLTLRGNCFIGHVGESIAHNAGIADWIAVDEEDYVKKAVTRAADPEGLARLRAGLRKQISASPLFDGKRFARNFEAALWEMWRRFRENQ